MYSEYYKVLSARFQLIPDQLYVTWNQLLTHILIAINISSVFTLVEVSTLLLWCAVRL